MSTSLEHNAVDKGKLPSRLISDGDLHYPIHDPVVEAAKLAFARDVKPDVWVNVGDTYDGWSLSAFDKPAKKFLGGQATLQKEIDAAKPYWLEVTKVAKRAHLILGNHENRVARLINEKPGLMGLKSFEWGVMAELPKGVTVHDYGTRLRVGSMTFEHGDKVPKGTKSPGRWLLQNRPYRNIVFGHSHHLSTDYWTIFDEHGEPHVYCAINQGHGSSLRAQAEYAYEPNWQHGFTYVEFWSEGGKPRFTAHAIPIVDGRFTFGGKLYDGRKWQ